MIEPGTAMLVGAGLDFAGGLMGRGGAGHAARQQLQHQVFLDREARDWNLQRIAEQYDWMREERAREDSFIQRRVRDAKAAGLHPLYALGASGGSSPSFSVGTSQAGSAVGAASGGRGNALSAVGRALTNYGLGKQAAQDRAEDRAHLKAVRNLELQRAQVNLSRDMLELNQAQASVYGRAAQDQSSQPGLGILADTDKTQPDAEDVEQRLGEAGQLWQGWQNTVRDYITRRIGMDAMSDLDRMMKKYGFGGPRTFRSPSDSQLARQIDKALRGYRSKFSRRKRKLPPPKKYPRGYKGHPWGHAGR